MVSSVVVAALLLRQSTPVGTIIGGAQGHGDQAGLERQKEPDGDGGDSAADAAFARRSPQAAPMDAVQRHDDAQVVMAMMFADVVGYSRLAEAQVPAFVKNVLGAVALLIKSLQPRQQPVVVNTWGDACHAVFRRVDDAGMFALMLSHVMEESDWAAAGLPPDLAMRISLHAAPVFKVRDPVTNAVRYTGVHCSRAARVEPVTPIGRIYCTEAFACIVEAVHVQQQFACTYVGSLALAKSYGRHPLYSLDWKEAVHPQDTDAG